MRIFYLLTFCCFLTACHNNAGNNAPGNDEPDLTVLTTKKFMLDRNPKVLRYLDSLYRAQKYKTPYIQAGRYLSLVNYSIFNSQANNAITYVDSAIAIIDRQDLGSIAWKNYYFSAHIIKGNRLLAKGDYTVAMDNFFKAKELADKIENACNINDEINNYIGLVLYKQKKYDDAQKYFKAAYRLLRTCAGEKYKALGEQGQLDNVALCFSKEGKSDSALAWYDKALRLTETDSDKFNKDPVLNKLTKEVCRGIISGNIAQVLVTENKLDSAELLFKRNIYINSVLHQNEIGDAQLSETYLADLYDRKGEYPKMKQVLDGLRKSLISQHSLHNQDAELGWRRLMVEYYHKENLQPEEFKYYKSYISYKDSLDNAKRESSESDISNELKTRAQQMQISLLQKDNQLDRVYLWITVGLSALALFIGTLIFYYYRQGKENIRALTLLNREVGEQNDQLEFTTGELKKSNADRKRILQVVAHDLRNPISGINRLASAAIDDDMPAEEELQSLNLIKNASANSLALINELLELELDHDKIVLDKAPVDINETVKQSVVLMQLIADKKHQKLQLTPLLKPLIVNMDRGRIERLINNLLSNAIKFSPLGEKIAIGIEQQGAVVLISVRDKGIGIAAEAQGELFETFGATRRKGTAGEKSFGLGLSISKQIVDAHRGRIWVESELDNGSVFYVELPL